MRVCVEAAQNNRWDMNKFTRILKPARNQKETPVEALHLAEDLAGLDLAIRLIESVDPMNIGDSDTQQQRDFNRDMKRSTLALIHAWKHYATLSMRRKYLTP
jgi:hypothetical protein